MLGTQPWLSTPGWCTRAATHMPHGWPTHPEHASRRAVQAGPGREHATANRHADAQLAGARGDARRVRDRADTRGHTHGTHTGSQATGRAPCSCCPMGTRPCSPVASAPDAEGRTAGPRGLGLAPGRRAGRGRVYSAGDGPARLTGFLTARSCPTAQEGGRLSERRRGQRPGRGTVPRSLDVTLPVNHLGLRYSALNVNGDETAAALDGARRTRTPVPLAPRGADPGPEPGAGSPSP